MLSETVEQEKTIFKFQLCKDEIVKKNRKIELTNELTNLYVLLICFQNQIFLV